MVWGLATKLEWQIPETRVGASLLRDDTGVTGASGIGCRDTNGPDNG